MIRVLFVPAQPEDDQEALLQRIPNLLPKFGARVPITPRIEHLPVPEGPAQRTRDIEQGLDPVWRFGTHILHVCSYGSIGWHTTEEGARFCLRVLRIVRPRCLILEGCFDPQQARLFLQYVDCVMGITAQSDWPERNDMVFGFYAALTAGRGLGAALFAATTSRDKKTSPVQVLVRDHVALEALLPSADEADIEMRAPVITMGPAIAEFSARHPKAPAAAAAAKPAAAAAAAAWVKPQPAKPLGRDLANALESIGVGVSAPSTDRNDPVDLRSAERAVPERYLNARLFRGDHPLPNTEAPILGAGRYQLGVHIGAFTGPGNPGEAIPDRLLKALFNREAVLVLDVVVRSRSVVVSPSVRPLRLAPSGDSELLLFDLSFPGAGRFSLSVDLLFRGHLLQSRRFDCTVYASADEARAAVRTADVPVQDSHVTFTRTTELSAEALSALAESPRRLTIVAEREPHSGSVVLRFYNSAGGEIGFRDTRFTDTSLVRVLKILRGQLVTTMHAYAGGIGGTNETLTQHLGVLADLGRRFHRALFGVSADANDRVQSALAAGTVIQVAPLSAQLSVPWEVVYDRPIETYRAGSIRLCPAYVQHGLSDCPHAADPQVVCPYGFWGYRYIIEQLPRRLNASEKLLPALPLCVENQLPISLLAVVNNRLRMQADHLAALSALCVMDFTAISTAERLKQALSGPAEQADLLYFYTHGGTDDFGSPYLELSGGSRVQPNDLDAWCRTLSRKPLVVLNACETASYSPDGFDDLIHLLCSRGAAGVIGTQCEVRELLAHEFILSFFARFLRQVEAGKAMLEARHALLMKRDPRGLAYSLFAAAEVKLRTAVL